MLLTIEAACPPDLLDRLATELPTCTWVSGGTTAGGVAAGVKQNRQVSLEDARGVALGNALRQALMAHPQFIAAALPLHVLRPRFNAYADGGHYGRHVDAPVMLQSDAPLPMRTDLSGTLFLSDPDHYTGGELVIEQASGTQTVKLARGSLVLYPAGTVHQVLPVTAGTRVAAFFWVQSLVPDTVRRQSLYVLDQSIQTLAGELGSQHAEVLRLSGVYGDLMRQSTVC